jgi:dTDP-4-dehydrorhamnose reductase
VRVIVIGAGGLLGTAFRLAADEQPEITDLLLPGRRELDVTEQVEVERYVSATRPDVVINAAVLLPADLCESHPEVAYSIHALGARWVARACARVGALPVYVSTDFVFDGTGRSPYLPDSAPHPVLTYGITKQAGEHETRVASGRHLVVRTAGLFGPAPSSPRARSCFVSRILERAAQGQPLRVVDTVVMSPTYTVDLARMTFALSFDGAVGTYHVVNQGSATWHELACAAVEMAGYDVRVEREEEQHHVATPRPTYTPLAGDLPGRVAGLQRPWRVALRECVDGLRQASEISAAGGRRGGERAGAPASEPATAAAAAAVGRRP